MRDWLTRLDILRLRIAIWWKKQLLKVARRYNQRRGRGKHE